jgi:hypothetical protein
VRLCTVCCISPQDHFICANINLVTVVADTNSSVMSGAAIQLQTLISVFSSVCVTLA